MLFSVAFGVPEKSVFTRLFCVFATAMLANFQDRLVMTASITLRVCYLIVFFLAFRILDRDHFGQVFYRHENGVFWTSFGGLLLASSRGCQTFQDRLVMTTSITLRKYDATACIIFTELLRCGSANSVRRIHFAYPTRRSTSSLVRRRVWVSSPKAK